MKKLCWGLFALLLLFGGCKRVASDGNTSVLSGVERVESVLGGKERFSMADEAFVGTNFDLDTLGDYVVLFESDGGYGEVGLFTVKEGDTASFERAVRDYLSREEEAIRSLAALYPAEELQARLACYEEALVGREGTLVYYFALPREQAQRAKTALLAK